MNKDQIETIIQITNAMRISGTIKEGWVETLKEFDEIQLANILQVAFIVIRNNVPPIKKISDEFKDRLIHTHNDGEFVEYIESSKEV